MERKAKGGKRGGKSRREGRERRGRDESGSGRGEGRVASWMLAGVDAPAMNYYTMLQYYGAF